VQHRGAALATPRRPDLLVHIFSDTVTDLPPWGWIVAIEASRTEALVDLFDAACRDLRDAVEAVPDDKWHVPTVGDGRQVNVVAHHAASAHRPIADMLQAMVQGKPASRDMEQIHAGNAEHARRFGSCSKTEVLEAHAEGSAYARDVLRGMTDERLSKHGELLIGMQGTVDQAIERVLIGHPGQHAATIRATLAAQ
jgi:mycothiol maleylpyruvate isomerase-like protein